MKIRPATPNDIPAVARVVLSALSDETPWKAFFPHKAQADLSYTESCEAILRTYLEPDNAATWLFLVAEISARESKTNTGPIIVAAAVWDISTTLGPDEGGRSRRSSIYGRLLSKSMETLESYSSEQCDGALDHGPAKLVALSRAIVEGRKKHFSGHDPYVFLHLLATRPDYQKKGYGKALCASGINVARQRHASVCVFSGARGYILFSGLGFVDNGRVDLPSEPGSYDVVIKAMLLDSRLVQRRGSILDSLMRYLTT